MEHSTETVDPVREMYYIFSLLQNEKTLSGSFEKTGEDSIINGRFAYLHVNRVLGKIEGKILIPYFSKPKVTLHVNEKGRKRESTTSIELNLVNSQKMEGTFNSTAADAKGKIIFTKKI